MADPIMDRKEEKSEEGIFKVIVSNGPPGPGPSASATSRTWKSRVGEREVNLENVTDCLYVKGHTIPVVLRHSEDHFFKYGCFEENPELSDQYRRCIYNFTHHVRAEDMEKHLSTCPAYWKYVIHENEDPMERVPGMDPRPTSVHITTLMPEVPDPENDLQHSTDLEDAVQKYLWTQLKAFAACCLGLAVFNYWLKK